MDTKKSTNVILIGYRGTGKSTIGKILAAKTGRTYVSTDQRIVEKAGMSIPQIVEKQGWTHFRDVESEVAAEVCGLSNHVIDTGGGIILREENVQRLKECGRLILLTASLETIVSRIQADPNRPPLKEGMTFLEEQKKVLEERNPIYRSIAELTVDTSKESIDSCVGVIVDCLSRFS